MSKWMMSSFSSLFFLCSIPKIAFIAVCNNVGDAAFSGRNQNLRILEWPSHEPHISGISCPTGIILGDSELYYVGLHEYVYILRNKDIFCEIGTFEPSVLYHDRERLYGSYYGHRWCLGNIK